MSVSPGIAVAADGTALYWVARVSVSSLRNYPALLYSYNTYYPAGTASGWYTDFEGGALYIVRRLDLGSGNGTTVFRLDMAAFDPSAPGVPGFCSQDPLEVAAVPGGGEGAPSSGDGPLVLLFGPNAVLRIDVRSSNYTLVPIGGPPSSAGALGYACAVEDSAAFGSYPGPHYTVRSCPAIAYDPEEDVLYRIFRPDGFPGGAQCGGLQGASPDAQGLLCIRAYITRTPGIARGPSQAGGTCRCTPPTDTTVLPLQLYVTAAASIAVDRRSNSLYVAEAPASYSGYPIGYPVSAPSWCAIRRVDLATWDVSTLAGVSASISTAAPAGSQPEGRAVPLPICWSVPTDGRADGLPIGRPGRLQLGGDGALWFLQADVLTSNTWGGLGVALQPAYIRRLSITHS